MEITPFPWNVTIHTTFSFALRHEPLPDRDGSITPKNRRRVYFAPDFSRSRYLGNSRVHRLFALTASYASNMGTLLFLEQTRQVRLCFIRKLSCAAVAVSKRFLLR